MFPRIACLVIGYLFGIVQTAYIYGKMNGIDIREHGSGNAGTTNALRVLGKKAGAIVFAGDFLKCFLSIHLVRIVFKNSAPNILPLLGIYAATGCILGHNFPVQLNFRGGKGIACTAGLLAAFDVRIGIIALLTFLAIVIATRYVSLGSMVIVTEFALFIIVFGQLGLLEGRVATCYPGFEEKLNGAIVCSTKVAVDGHVITSKGMGTAIDFSLKLIELLVDKETADKIGAGIIYYV